MSTFARHVRVGISLSQAAAWFPLVALPGTVIVLGANWHPAARMWALAISVLTGLKWLTFATSDLALQATKWRIFGYLVLWPGLNANQFLHGRSEDAGSLAEWAAACSKTLVGVLLVLLAARQADQWNPLLTGWLGMVGLVLVFHCGIFHLLSLTWRAAGVEAPPLMNSPLRAHSLSDFWSRRWNVAFRDLANRFIFRPLAARLGVSAATLGAFLFSGLIHDLVISIPVGTAVGLPTLYFLTQGMAVLIERSPLGRRVGLGVGWRGRLYAAGVLILPLGMLFHSPFVLRAIVPTLRLLEMTP